MTRQSLRPGMLAAALLLAGAAAAQTAQPTAPDNTRNNGGTRDGSQVSADDQANNDADLALTQTIRREIIADKRLSLYAHNAKVVSINGVVTLSGVVRSIQEKSIIEATAARAAGSAHVVDNLNVQPQG